MSLLTSKKPERMDKRLASVMEKQKKTRLIVEIDRELHDQIKYLAIKRKAFMKNLVSEALMEWTSMQNHKYK